MSVLPMVSQSLATAYVCQISYDVASLSGSLAHSRDDETGTYAAICRRDLAKIRDALTQIERHLGPAGVA